MDYRDKIIADIAKETAERLVRRTILQLQKMTEYRLSGDDSELKNTWDEICVQVQREESFAWDTYIETIKALLGSDIENLPVWTKRAMWLQTSQGSHWWVTASGDEEDCPCCEEDITDWIIQAHLLRKAGAWENKRLRAYLER